ncbi:MAG TPA: AAA family ATPase [Vicinamibacteria bacterium]|nr:AAA family ATPase [Vicinamibacteria bacterium]
MYIRYYGFSDKPFKLTQDLAYYYGPPVNVPLNELRYSIEERLGLATLVAAPGMGKTTLLRRLVASFNNRLRGVLLSDASLSGQPLLVQLSTALRLPLEKQPWQNLASFLRNEALRQRRVVLLIDEAQGLLSGQLDELRYLTNLEMRGSKLMEIILAGQPSLNRRLASSELEALQQRVAVRASIKPLDLAHTEAYIQHRLRVAGAKSPGMFAADAVQIIHEKSGGVPRLINTICDRSLLVGFAHSLDDITASVVEDAIADLQLEPESDSAPSSTGAGSIEENLLLRIGAQLEVIEDKLDSMAQGLARGGLGQSGDTENSRLRRWLQSLHEDPSETGSDRLIEGARGPVRKS